MPAPFLNPITPRIVEVFYQSPPVYFGTDGEGEFLSALVERHVECPGGGLQVDVIVPEGSFRAHDQATADAAATAYADQISAQSVEEQCSALQPTFEQFDGPFVFPEKAFEGGGMYFKTQTAVGENRTHYDINFLGIDHSHGAGSLPPVSGGVKATQWSGSATYNSETDSYEGGIQVVWKEGGILPGGVNTLRLAGPDQVLEAETVEQAFQAVLSDFVFSARTELDSFGHDGSWVKVYFSETPGPSIGGFFGGGVMGIIWVDGYTLRVTNSDPITVRDLGHEIVRIGTPARTQHLTGYDPNTRTYVGNKSRAKIKVKIPAGKTSMFGEFKFLVTPDDDSTPYTIIKSFDYVVVPGTTFEAVVEFPWIVDAEVFFVTSTFSFNPSSFFDFSAVTETESLIIPASENWPLGADFICPPRNGDVWDDFQEAEGQDVLSSVSTGYGWADNGRFAALSRLDCDDDLSSYDAQDPIYALPSGFGFKAPGVIVLDVARPVADDQFDDYAVGMISSLTGGTGFWSDEGFFD